jgi:hypothetical protein
VTTTTELVTKLVAYTYSYPIETQYNMGCPKSHTMKFKAKYFVSVTAKFQFAMPSGNIGLMSLQNVSGLTRFLCTCCSLLSCLYKKHHVVFNNALINIIFKHSHMKKLNRHITCTSLMLLYQVSQQFFNLLFNSATLHRVSTNMLKCWVKSTTGWEALSYVVTT